MGEVLDRTDLLVTVSSTAALESLHRGIPTAVLTDLGIREALGNHHFLGSGCLASWDQLDAGHAPAPDEEWLARQGVAADGPYATRLRRRPARRVAELLAAAGSCPPLAPYYTPRHRPRLPARHPRPPPPRPRRRTAARRGRRAGRAERGAPCTRRLARGAARGAYRHGVQRVAPVIRRMGEL